MTSILNPYLGFGHEARQALEFYQGVFGGDLTISTFGEYGTQGPDGDLVMHGQLSTPAGYTIMAADTPSFMERREGTSVSVALTGDDHEALHGYFDALSQGGQVGTPLAKQMWGDEYGDLTDRFGTRWVVNIGSDSGSGGDQPG